MNDFRDYLNDPTGVFDKRFYTKLELSQILSISIRTLELRMKDGSLPYKKFGRVVRFSGVELNKAMKSESTAA